MPLRFAPVVNPTPSGTSFGDPSGAIFNMYTTSAQEFDKENVENWKQGADTILVFIGLFSSTVATFIALSYPSLQQDPNVVTHSLLAQIVAQQLSSANSTGLIPPTTQTTQTPFSPSSSVVFVNSVWFLSLVLSLTCALMATLLQQWARRYLQMVQQNHPPDIRAHIREYFYQGARRFGIFGLVELLPSLIVVAVLLFFAGLVVFAFLANHTVASITLSIVGFCFLLYIVFTLMPLIFHDCPYCTPLTSVLWFASRKIGLAFHWVRDRGAAYLHRDLDLLSEERVELYRQTYEKKAKLWSEDMVSQLQVSAKSISIGICTKLFGWTLHQISNDHELEEFAAGIPDLYESKHIATTADITHDIQTHLLEERMDRRFQLRFSTERKIRRVLADLPVLTNFSDLPLSWTIFFLAVGAKMSNLSKDNQHKRIRTCLTALYHVPGAIRDLLSPYAAKEDLFYYAAVLLNYPESLEIIDELWDLLNSDVRLSVRCAAAVAAAFMIAPPPMLDTSGPLFIGNDNTGKQFLAKRLCDDPTADGDVDSDAARLKNIVRFVADIKDLLTDVSREDFLSRQPPSTRKHWHPFDCGA